MYIATLKEVHRPGHVSIVFKKTTLKEVHRPKLPYRARVPFSPGLWPGKVKRTSQKSTRLGVSQFRPSLSPFQCVF